MLRTPKHISFKEYIDKAIKISNDFYCINLNTKSREGSLRHAYKSYC
jgi:hypothetical protein